MKEKYMAKYLFVLIPMFVAQASATGWRPPERLLHAVRYVESTDGLFTYGDLGKSLGDFQLSEGAWIDVTAWRKARQLKTYDYDRHVYNRVVNRAYAANYITMLHDELERVYKREPSAGEIYAAYNMGLGKFANCKYRLNQVNRTTARKCEQIKAFMSVAPPIRLAAR
jgi:hypothetical protein